jgi:hypothetical protein
LVYGAIVGAPFVAIKFEIFPLLPGGGKIPLRKGPGVQLVNPGADPIVAIGVKVQPLSSRVAAGDSP